MRHYLFGYVRFEAIALFACAWLVKRLDSLKKNRDQAGMCFYNAKNVRVLFIYGNTKAHTAPRSDWGICAILP